MKNKLLRLSGRTVGVGASVAPFIAMAQPVDQCSSVGTGTLAFILCKASVLINSIIPFLIALGVVFFIWGVISYAIAKDEEAKTKGRSAMIMGIIALLVIVSIWGLVRILQRSFGVANEAQLQIPCIEGTPGSGC